MSSNIIDLDNHTNVSSTDVSEEEEDDEDEKKTPHHNVTVVLKEVKLINMITLVKKSKMLSRN
jgi:small nuclear ribonucleoprotein (snRNP)-like protein